MRTPTPDEIADWPETQINHGEPPAWVTDTLALWTDRSILLVVAGRDCVVRRYRYVLRTSVLHGCSRYNTRMGCQVDAYRRVRRLTLGTALRARSRVNTKPNGGRASTWLRGKTRMGLGACPHGGVAQWESRFFARTRFRVRLSALPPMMSVAETKVR